VPDDRGADRRARDALSVEVQLTAQSSEILENEHSDFRPGAWRLFAVIRGAPTKDNHGWGDRAPDGSLARVYRADPGEAESVSSANWKGYTEAYRLGRDGRLTLLRFDYDESSRPTRIVNETLEGDFFVVLKALFNGPRLYVPFREGVLVLDRSAWLHEAYTGPSPVSTELRPGCDPSYPENPRLWYE
jgi:hypothetical protein